MLNAACWFRGDQEILQLETERIPLAIRSGAAMRAGILAEIKTVWNGASAAVLVPAPAIPIPRSADSRLPAQVGQPTNRPVVAPIPPTTAFFAWCDLFLNLYAKILSETLNPTSAETAAARITFTGITRIKK